MKLSITYLTHCSFIVESENYQLVFDWIKGEIPKTKKKRICFITHSHPDHYQPEILDVDFDAFVISNDVDIDLKENMVHVKEGDCLTIDELEIEVFGSTDLGVSYWVKVDGVYLFFAGDLNNWHWKMESTQEEIDEMNDWYLSLIKPLSRKLIDVLFIDIDPRLKVDYDLGAKQILLLTHPQVVIPMHFTSDIEAFEKYVERSQIQQLLPLIKDNTMVDIHVVKNDESNTNN